VKKASNFFYFSKILIPCVLHKKKKKKKKLLGPVIFFSGENSTFCYIKIVPSSGLFWKNFQKNHQIWRKESYEKFNIFGEGFGQICSFLLLKLP